VLAPETTIVLIGLRGSGKTTVAKLLAERVGRAAVDLDDLTPKYLNASTAAAALTTHGEPAFRRAELAALQDVLKTPGRVLALGGGTPTAPGVSEMLEGAQRQGKVKIVYLRANEQTLRARLAAEPAHIRPSLTGKGTLEEICVLLNLRDTLYKGLAWLALNVDNRDAAAIAEDIQQSINAHP
jgi:shikimate kinase